MQIDSSVTLPGAVNTAMQQQSGQSGCVLSPPFTSQVQGSYIQIDSPVAHPRQVNSAMQEQLLQSGQSGRVLSPSSRSSHVQIDSPVTYPSEVSSAVQELSQSGQS